MVFKTKNIFHFFNRPEVVLFIIIIFLISYLVTTQQIGGYRGNLTSFGPTYDENGEPINFFGLTLDNWNRVIIAYVIIFISSLMHSYYTNVVSINLQSYIYSPVVETLPFSKMWTYILLIVDPLIKIILYVIQFFATATFQIQYILPQFVANYISTIPYVIYWLKNKQFIPI